MTFINGASIDTRPDSEKEKDYKQIELVASLAPTPWREKPQSEWRSFPIFDQNGSGSCVAQSEAKELGIMRWLKNQNEGYVHFSATDIYQRRANKPAPGMAAIDARKIAAQGVTLEVLTPSQNMTDMQMDTMPVEAYKREVGKVFAAPQYLDMNVKDIEAVASTIHTTGKGVMVWFYFQGDEWTDRPVVKNPALDLNAAATLRHSVCAVDFTLVGGKKALIIEDSWGIGAGVGGRRVIDEDFYRSRNWFAGYLMNFKFDQQSIPRPFHRFDRNLAFSPTFTIDTDVRKLQDILKYEGMFPANTESSGYYGAITAKSVLAWQKLHKVASDSELDPLQGKTVGPKTRTVLNSIYGN